ncbi:MAG: hypothetical protein RR100_12390, partial [Comamonas sp.]
MKRLLHALQQLLLLITPGDHATASAALHRQQKSLSSCDERLLNLVGAIGLEPTTPTMSRW